METTDAAPRRDDPLDMPLEQVMRSQRAMRRLRTDRVDDAVVLRCIELALGAPTGSNAQNWEFIVVKDPEVKARLGRLTRRGWLVQWGRLAGGHALKYAPWYLPNGN